MMLFKLAVKNIFKSMKDYAIYFFTLILGVAIFYVFNALDSQTVMLEVSQSTQELIELMMTVLSGVSVFVAFVLGFLIIYASRFLMKRRDKEFGVYMLLGMGKRKLGMILFLETLMIGVMSLGVGLLVGVVLSQLMSILVADMFEANMTRFQFVFSGEAALKTLAYFGVMYVVVILFNILVVSRVKLIDLLNGAKKNERVRMKRPGVCVLVFLAACGMLGWAYHRVCFETVADEAAIVPPILCGVVATFLIFWSVSGLMLRVVSSLKRVYFRGLNSFTLRQFSSKINTAVVSSGVICLMLFLTICLLASCLTVKNSMNENIKELAPADIELVAKFGNGDGTGVAWRADGVTFVVGEKEGSAAEKEAGGGERITHPTVMDVYASRGLDLKDKLAEYVEVESYDLRDLTLGAMLGESLEEISAQFPFLLYETMEPVMRVSDYNKVARLYGQPEYSVGSDEYVLLADFKSMAEVNNVALSKGQEVTVFGEVLRPKYAEAQAGFLEMSSQHINTGLVLVADEVVDRGLREAGEEVFVSSWLMGNYKEMSEAEMVELEEKINEIADGMTAGAASLVEGVADETAILMLDGTTKRMIKEATTGLTGMVTFIGLYLGVIFLMASAAILGLKELSESSDNRERYAVLRRIGTDEKMINRALLRQMGIFFGLPLLLAIIHSVFGLIFAMRILEVFGDEMLGPSIAMTAVFIVVIYGGYFGITYWCGKGIIRE